MNGDDNESSASGNNRSNAPDTLHSAESQTGNELRDTMAVATPETASSATPGEPSADGDAFGVSLRGGMAADALFGDATANVTVTNDNSQSLHGSEGDDHLWDDLHGSEEGLDVFVKETGSGTDYIHDFRVEEDVVDLTAYNITFNDLKGAMEDVGWATQIELTGFSGQIDDRIFLKNVEPDQLGESNFTL